MFGDMPGHDWIVGRSIAAAFSRFSASCVFPARKPSLSSDPSESSATPDPEASLIDCAGSLRATVEVRDASYSPASPSRSAICDDRCWAGVVEHQGGRQAQAGLCGQAVA